MLGHSLPATRSPAALIEPFPSTLGHTVPAGPLWVHEIKFDIGSSAGATANGGRAFAGQSLSRCSESRLTSPALAQQPCQGRVVVPGADGADQGH